MATPRMDNILFTLLWLYGKSYSRLEKIVSLREGKFMYALYLNYQVNKNKNEYILLLSNIYPKDRDKFKSWRKAQLKAVYINYLKKRDNQVV
jgi:hypothetical protein